MLGRLAPVALAALLTACSPGWNETRDRYDLYAVEPDRVARGRVVLLDSEETVAEKMGRPSMRFEMKLGGNRWTEWTYARRVEAWQPPDVDDTSIMSGPRDGDPYAARSSTKVRLTFVNGRLRVIEQPGLGQVESNLLLPDERGEYREFQRSVGDGQ